MRVYRTLDIFLIVLFIAVISVIVISSLPEPKLNPKSFGSEIIPMFRFLSAVQNQYYSKDKTFATADQLCCTYLTDTELGISLNNDSPLYDYYLKMSVIDGKKWWCIARPVAWDSPDCRNYFISTDGVIYYNEEENSSEFAKKIGD